MHSTNEEMPMLDCQAVMRQLWDYLDGELTVERTEAIKGHLAMCDRCYPQYEFERTFLGQLGGLRREHSDLSSLRSRLLGVLEANGLTVGG
jgi:anti-sigma factor (TIGR02949 family)